MAGSRKRRETLSEFWCINCGKKGIPIMRDRSGIRGAGHRKALYCVTCRTVVNHVETRNAEEAQRFREDYDAGRYAEEAEASIAYAREHRI